MTDSHHHKGATVAHAWWQRLVRPDGPNLGQRRAALARIRRASTPIEVMHEQEALRLIERLPSSTGSSSHSRRSPRVRSRNRREECRPRHRSPLPRRRRPGTRFRRALPPPSTDPERRAHGVDAAPRTHGQGKAQRPRPVLRHSRLGRWISGRSGKATLDLRLLPCARPHPFGRECAGIVRSEATSRIGIKE